jgi:acetyltransferase-like isoleucine patch superfamily enzyme
MSKNRLAIAGFHEGLAGQVASWVESADPSLELVCFLHPHTEMPSVTEAARLNRASSRFIFPSHGEYRGRPLIFGVDWELQLRRLGISHILPAIPDPRERADLVQAAIAHNFVLPTAVHPSAVILPGADIAQGCILEPKVYVGLDAEIGIACQLHAGSQVDHNSVLGDFVTLNPNAIVAGNAYVGSRSSINLSASVSNGVRLAERTTVGAGALVLCSFSESGLRLLGIPAEPR